MNLKQKTGREVYDGRIEAVKEVIDPVILNLFQDLNAWDLRPRNKFGVTRFARILIFETIAS